MCSRDGLVYLPEKKLTPAQKNETAVTRGIELGRVAPPKFHPIAMRKVRSEKRPDDASPSGPAYNPLIPKQPRQPAECSVKLIRIAQRCFEQAKLLMRRLDRLYRQGNSDDRAFGLKLFEMRVQHPEKNFDVVCRFRDFKTSLVTAFVQNVSRSVNSLVTR